MYLSLLALLPLATATIYTTNPVGKTVAVGDQVLKVDWSDDGATPTVQTIGKCSIDLCIGTQTQQTCLLNLGASVDVSAASTLSTTIDATIGENGKHYFIKYSSLDHQVNGQAYTQFSATFELSNMKGTFTAEQQKLVDAQVAADAAKNGGAAPTGSPTGVRAASPASVSSSKSSTSASASGKAAAASASPSSGAAAFLAPVGLAIAAAIGGYIAI